MRALFVVLVFMFSPSGWAQSNPPAPSAAQGQQNKGDGKQKAENKQEAQAQQSPAAPVGITVIATGGNAPQPQGGEGKAPEWGAVIVASLALIVACGALFVAFRQMRLFQVQLGHMESALKDGAAMANAAKDSAKVALIQANTTMDAERAYVKILHVKPGLEILDEQSAVVKVEVKNLGRTPAQVTDAHIDFAFFDYGTPLPIPYPFRPMQRESYPNAFLVPNELITVSRHVKTKEALAPGKQLWVFGEVDYIDVFNRRWRGGYARKYQDQKDDNLVYNTEARDNFDRERTPNEGRDWDEESKAAFFARKGKLPS